MRRSIKLICLLLMSFAMEAHSSVNTEFETATFAGGCFWCIEAAFEKAEGVVEVISGFTGGHTENPTYEEVCSGTTGHYEAVQVTYDPSKIYYTELLNIFWREIDPTDPSGQFCDRGAQYRTAIFYHNDGQRRLAEESKEELEKSGTFGKPIVTEIIKASKFYRAEDYHQNYYKVCPVRYASYREASGRDRYLEKVWPDQEHTLDSRSNSSTFNKPDEEGLRRMLTPLQYRVTQEDGTERPFENEYWDEKRDGIYVDVVSGKPLFSSLDKFDSESGWPSFTKPLEPENLVEKEDSSLAVVRTEVRSRHADSHLGHVFNDGPPPTGLRYCINSAALRFVPKEDLEEENYGEYKELFEE